MSAAGCVCSFLTAISLASTTSRLLGGKLISLWRPDHFAAVIPQGLVQVRVIKDAPETSYDLSVSLRLIRNHMADLPQHKCSKCVAAALQGRPYPATSTSWTCTKTSEPPPSGAMKPNPRSVLKNLTRPVGMIINPP